MTLRFVCLMRSAPTAGTPHPGNRNTGACWGPRFRAGPAAARKRHSQTFYDPSKLGSGTSELVSCYVSPSQRSITALVIEQRVARRKLAQTFSRLDQERRSAYNSAFICQSKHPLYMSSKRLEK